jgi:hypothetical protein
MPWAAADSDHLWTVREVTAPEPLPPHVPDELAQACLRCLAPDPDGRPDAAELTTVLRAATPQGGAAQLAKLAATTSETTYLLARPRSTLLARPRPSRWLVGAAAAVLVAIVGWSAVAWSPSAADVPAVLAEGAAPPGPGSPACAVTFAVASDGDQRFHAAIAAAPAQPLAAGWRLSMRLPPSPMDIDPAGGWDRRADVVTSAPQPGVAAGASVTLTLFGSHDGTIVFPTKINVDGRPCDVVLLDASARPEPPAAADPAPPPDPAAAAPALAPAKTPKATTPKAPAKPAADKGKPAPDRR